MAAVEEAMSKAKVIQFLELFPEIDEEIRARRSIITDLEQCYYNTMSGVQYGVTKGNYHVSSQTEKTAMNIPDYVRKEIRLYQTEIEDLQAIKVEILKEVSRLKLKCKKIVFGFYFHNMKWEEVAERTNYSDRQCKNIRDEALERLLQGFSNNKVLIAYKFK